MGTKIVFWVAYTLGIGTYIGGIMAQIGWWDMDNWKKNVLFIIAALIGIARLFFFCIKQWQLYLFRKKQLNKKDD